MKQLESELTQLELISPLFARDGPFALLYWRNRITALLADPYVISSGARRIAWLLDLLDEIEGRACVAPPHRAELIHAQKQVPVR